MAFSQIKLFNTKEEVIEGNDAESVTAKPYTKYINFYKMFLNPSFREPNVTDKQLICRTIDNIFRNNNSILVDDAIIECLEKNEEFIFGCLHRNSEIDILTEVKSSIDGSNIDINELIFENVTYFFIDYTTFGVSVIKTQRIQSSYEYIKKLIISNSSLNVDIIPLVKTQEQINDMVAKSMQLNFVDLQRSFEPLNILDSNDCELSDLKIKVKFRRTNRSFIPKILSSFKGHPNVKKLSISTDTEDIDLLKNSFTRQVAIELTKDYKQDFNRIRDSLKDELLKIINA